MSFLRLPPELRYQTYALAVPENNSIVVQPGETPAVEDVLGNFDFASLVRKGHYPYGFGHLQCSRTVARECAFIFYARNRFEFRCRNMDWSRVFSFLNMIGPTNRSYLRDVYICVFFEHSGKCPAPHATTSCYRLLVQEQPKLQLRLYAQSTRLSTDSPQRLLAHATPSEIFRRFYLVEKLSNSNYMTAEWCHGSRHIGEADWNILKSDLESGSWGKPGTRMHFVLSKAH